jgi:RHS repeat-associated protein
MPEREYNVGSYRYGFNGKESDNEVSGNGNQYDYGFRIYNPRLGKFLSVDPLLKDYPWYTPYQFAGNTPIQAIDLDGLEPKTMIQANGKLTKPMVSLLNAAFLYTKSSLQNATWVPYTSSSVSVKMWAKAMRIPNETSASVMGQTVVHDNEQERSDSRWFGLIVHEQSHEMDIENQGNVSFYGGYVGEAIFTPYKQIGTEATAYVNGNDGHDGYAAQLFQFQNGIVLQTLNNTNLSEDEKATTLEAVGAKFRRDVILNDKFTSNQNLINQTQSYLNANTGLSQNEVAFNNNIIANLQQQNSSIRQEQEQITNTYGQ